MTAYGRMVRMARKKYKTSENQRRLVKEYESTKDRINVLFPAGTIDRMRNLGVSDRNKSTFIKYAVEQMLAEMEREADKGEAQLNAFNRMLAYKEFAEQMAANKRQGRKKKKPEESPEETGEPEE